MCGTTACESHVGVRVQGGSKASERLVVLWQVAVAVVLVGVGVSLLASLVMMPRAGYGCAVCEDVACQDLLGWHCGIAVDRVRFCDVEVYPDGRKLLVCPAGAKHPLAVAADARLQGREVDAVCEAWCRSADSNGSVPGTPRAPAPAADGDDDGSSFVFGGGPPLV
jgi:hypothetical protein